MIEHIDEEIIIFNNKEYSISLIDTLKDNTRIRTIYFYKDNKKIKIGDFYANCMAGNKEWFEYNEKAIVILRTSAFAKSIMVKKLFSIEELGFIEGYDDDLYQAYKELFLPPKDEYKKRLQIRYI